MDNAVLVALIGSATTVLVALIGWVFAWRINKDTKELNRFKFTSQEFKAKCEEFKTEIETRIILENIAIKQLSVLTDEPERTVKIELREKCKAASGRKPKHSSSTLDFDYIDRK